MMSFRSKLTKIVSPPEFPELFFVNMKLSPSGGNDVASELPVGQFVFDDFEKFYNSPILFSLLQFFHWTHIHLSLGI